MPANHCAFSEDMATCMLEVIMLVVLEKCHENDVPSSATRCLYDAYRFIF
jgi:hypothetical protein